MYLCKLLFYSDSSHSVKMFEGWQIIFIYQRVVISLSAITKEDFMLEIEHILKNSCTTEKKIIRH